jgi:hypothetical protein
MMQGSKIQQLMDLLHSLPDEAVVDLGALLKEWERQSPTMDREEALVRLLWELSKETGAPD